MSYLYNLTSLDVMISEKRFFNDTPGKKKKQKTKFKLLRLANAFALKLV